MERLLVMGAKQRLFVLNLIQAIALRLIAHHPLRHREILIACLKPFVQKDYMIDYKYLQYSYCVYYDHK